jgi:pyridoxal phosphate enzyme (YggS family)
VLTERYQEIADRVARAAARAARRPEEITLIAVTKLFPARAILDAYQLGLRHFGENYVQEFASKFPEVNHLEGARFHLIGHLQSNKSALASSLFSTIQTVDSPRLARRLDAAGRPLEVLLEVKLSEEDSKSGAAPSDLPALVESVRACPNLSLTGLMTMPPFFDEPERARPYFARLRQEAARYGLKKLSMGMSGDFEAAIEEGATHIRIGTALFGPR